MLLQAKVTLGWAEASSDMKKAADAVRNGMSRETIRAWAEARCCCPVFAVHVTKVTLNVGGLKAPEIQVPEVADGTLVVGVPFYGEMEVEAYATSPEELARQAEGPPWGPDEDDPAPTSHTERFKAHIAADLCMTVLADSTVEYALIRWDWL